MYTDTRRKSSPSLSPLSVYIPVVVYHFFFCTSQQQQFHWVHFRDEVPGKSFRFDVVGVLSSPPSWGRLSYGGNWQRGRL